MLFLIGLKDLELMLLKNKFDDVNMAIKPITKEDVIKEIKGSEDVVVSLNAYAVAAPLTDEERIYTANSVGKPKDNMILCLDNVEKGVHKRLKSDLYDNAAFFKVDLRW